MEDIVGKYKNLFQVSKSVKTENEIKYKCQSCERLSNDSIEIAVKYFSTFPSGREHP